MSFKTLSTLAAAALALCGGAAQAQSNAFANPSFEAAATVTGQFAQGWRGTNGPTAGNRTNTDAHTGVYSAVLRVLDPGFGGSGLAQNTVEDGLLSVDPQNWGTSPSFSFWVKGNASVTGNLSYAVRYLDSIGNILNPATGATQNNIQASGLVSPNVWQQVTRSNLGAIPVNTSAVFLEMTLATGPTGVTTNPDNSVTDYGQARVLIDDVNLTLAYPVAAVPEPMSMALMLAGLGIVAPIVRRRRQSA
jgi:hypothetical protein